MVQLAQDIWNLLEPGIKPVSSTLADGFLSTVPPGKSVVQSLSRVPLFATLTSSFCLEIWVTFPDKRASLG